MILEGEQVKPAAKPPRRPNRPQAEPVYQSGNAPSPTSGSGDKILRAPIPGTIVEVKASSGQMVKEGDVALVLEAMKMESDIHFSHSGRISKIHVNKGDSVQEGDPLIELEG